MAIDEGDFCVAERQKMPRHRAGSFEIVDADRSHAGARLPGRHHHGGNPRFGHGSQRFLGIAQGRRQYDSISAGIGEALHRFALVFHAVAFLDTQLAAGNARLFQASQQEFAQISRAGIGIEQPDPHRIGAGEAARRKIGRIAQRLDRGGDFGAGGIADIAFGIDDARNRHRRDTGVTRHVMDGHDIPAAPSAFLGQIPSPNGSGGKLKPESKISPLRRRAPKSANPGRQIDWSLLVKIGFSIYSFGHRACGVPSARMMAFAIICEP
jgi:hypothetical protein